MARISTFYDHILTISHQEKISVTEALLEAKKMGIELLEVSRDNLVGREDEVVGELAHAGMGISSVPVFFDFGRDTDVDRQSEPVLEVARFSGADKILVIPGFFAPEDGPEERERQFEAMIGCVNRLADKAAGYGVRLVMEDFDSALSPCSTVAGLGRFLDACPGLSCCFDTGNFRFMAEDVKDAYEAFRGRIGHVHLKDRAYAPLNGEEGLPAGDGQNLYPCPVGGGALPLGDVVARLRKDGYDGVFALEHYGAAHMLDTLRASAAWVKKQLA